MTRSEIKQIARPLLSLADFGMYMVCSAQLERSLPEYYLRSRESVGARARARALAQAGEIRKKKAVIFGQHNMIQLPVATEQYQVSEIQLPVATEQYQVSEIQLPVATEQCQVSEILHAQY